MKAELIKRNTKNAALALMAIWVVGVFFTGTSTDFVSGEGVIHDLVLGILSFAIALVVGFFIVVYCNSTFLLGRMLGRGFVKAISPRVNDGADHE